MYMWNLILSVCSYSMGISSLFHAPGWVRTLCRILLPIFVLWSLMSTSSQGCANGVSSGFSLCQGEVLRVAVKCSTPDVRNGLWKRRTNTIIVPFPLPKEKWSQPIQKKELLFYWNLCFRTKFQCEIKSRNINASCSLKMKKKCQNSTASY